MRYLPRAFLAGGIGFAVSCLAACGGGAGLLSGSQSATIQGKLDQLASAVSNGQCGPAANRAAQLSRQVNQLPNTVSLTLRQDLANGVATVSTLAARDCGQNQSTTSTSATSSTTTTTPPTTTTTPTTSTTTSTTSSTTPTTTTSTTTTTTPTTATTTTTTPSSGGGGLGGGGLGGGGGGGQSGDPGASGHDG
jgi:hypothetical protein